LYPTRVCCELDLHISLFTANIVLVALDLFNSNYVVNLHIVLDQWRCLTSLSHNVIVALILDVHEDLDLTALAPAIEVFLVDAHDLAFLPGGDAFLTVETGTWSSISLLGGY